jgi:hypothetical protein
MNMSQQLIAIALIAGAASASAQTIKLKLTPGLWEENSKTLINGQNVQELMRAQMEKAMAKMTPEQKAQMQKTMDAIGSAGKHQTCLTPEYVAKGLNLDSVKDQLQKAAPGCHLNLISASENGGKFDMACSQANGGAAQSTGEYIVKNDKEWSYKFNGSGRTAAAGGNGEAISMQVSGEIVARWKGSNCGNVAPTE